MASPGVKTISFSRIKSNESSWLSYSWFSSCRRRPKEKSSEQDAQNVTDVQTPLSVATTSEPKSPVSPASPVSIIAGSFVQLGNVPTYAAEPEKEDDDPDIVLSPNPLVQTAFTSSRSLSPEVELQVIKSESKSEAEEKPLTVTQERSATPEPSIVSATPNLKIALPSEKESKPVEAKACCSTATKLKILLNVTGLGACAAAIALIVEHFRKAETIEDKIFYIGLYSYVLGIGVELTAYTWEKIHHVLTKGFTDHIFIFLTIQGLIDADLGGWRSPLGMTFIAMTSPVVSALTVARLLLTRSFNKLLGRPLPSSLPLELEDAKPVVEESKQSAQQSLEKKQQENLTLDEIKQQVGIAVISQEEMKEQKQIETKATRCSQFGGLVREYVGEYILGRKRTHLSALALLAAGLLMKSYSSNSFAEQVCEKGLIYTSVILPSTVLLKKLAVYLLRHYNDYDVSKILSYFFPLFIPGGLDPLSIFRLIGSGGVLEVNHQHVMGVLRHISSMRKLDRKSLTEMPNLLFCLAKLAKDPTFADLFSVDDKVFTLKSSAVWGLIAAVFGLISAYAGSGVVTFQLFIGYIGAFAGYNLPKFIRLPSTQDYTEVMSSFRTLADYLTRKNLMPVLTLLSFYVKIVWSQFYPVTIQNTLPPDWTRDWVATPLDYFIFLFIAGLWYSLSHSRNILSYLTKEQRDKLKKIEEKLKEIFAKTPRFQFEEKPGKESAATEADLELSSQELKYIAELMKDDMAMWLQKYEEFEKVNVAEQEKNVVEEQEITKPVVLQSQPALEIESEDELAETKNREKCLSVETDLETNKEEKSLSAERAVVPVPFYAKKPGIYIIVRDAPAPPPVPKPGIMQIMGATANADDGHIAQLEINLSLFT